MAKLGPRAKRILERELKAAVEEKVELFVRERMRPILMANARAAQAGFKRERGK